MNIIRQTLELILLAISIVICSRAGGAELRLVSLDIETFYSKHDPFLPEYATYKRSQLPYQQSGKEQWSYSLKLRNDILLFNSILGDTLWENVITGASTTNQFRYVGYEFYVRQRLTDNFSIFYHHHSEHGLDTYRRGYPLQDSFGINVCFGGSECQ